MDYQELERLMRPGNLSKKGFLGPNESLEIVLKEDEEAVRKLGLTHEQIANGLEYMMNEAFYESRYYKNKNRLPSNYTIEMDHTCGYQECPWDDVGGFREEDRGCISFCLCKRRRILSIFEGHWGEIVQNRKDDYSLVAGIEQYSVIVKVRSVICNLSLS